MQIDVIGRHLEVTPAIHDHATVRAEKLPRFYGAVQKVEVVTEKTGEHTFKAEVICHIDNHDHIVGKAKDGDLHVAIDGAAGKVERQLHDLKEKQRGH